jgi:hypothetical protein
LLSMCEALESISITTWGAKEAKKENTVSWLHPEFDYKTLSLTKLLLVFRTSFAMTMTRIVSLRLMKSEVKGFCVLYLLLLLCPNFVRPFSRLPFPFLC